MTHEHAWTPTGHQWLAMIWVRGKAHGKTLRTEMRCACGALGFRCGRSPVVYYCGDERAEDLQ